MKTRKLKPEKFNTKYRIGKSKTYTGPSSVTLKGNYMKEKLDWPTSKLLTEKDKEELTEIKRKFQWYKQIGLNHVQTVSSEIERLEKLSNGVIVKSDFIKGEEIEKLQTLDPSLTFEEDSVELEFFPITPNIINYLEGEVDKKFISFSAQAINPEVSNEIIEQRNLELKEILTQYIQESLKNSVPPEQIQQAVQEKLTHYRVNFRHEIEQWANHIIELENKKFNMPIISRNIFRNLLVHEEPYVHVNLIEDYYYPEVLDTKNCFFLKSKTVKDASDYTMFGWFQYENINTVLNKYQLSKEDTELINKWVGFKAHAFTFNGQYRWGEGPYSTSEQESLHNYRAFQSLANDGYSPANRMLRITSMYWLEPKRIGLLTVNVDGELQTTTVNDNFKRTEIPKYKFNKKKKEYLLEGEHLEWVYINELWKGVEIAPLWSTNSLELQDQTSIYVKLAPHPIQYSHKHLKYGIKIPVHGGSQTGWSIASRTYSWQKFYNYLGNRNKQLLYTEIGKFLLLNQSLIPDTSVNGSWSEKGLLKFFVQAKELSLGITDNSATNTGLLAQQGVGQLVDLTKTQEVADKMKLMQMVKQECYESIGINAGLIQQQSPYQTATSTAQQQGVASSQLQTLYARHIDILRSLRETMLETALYLTSKGEYRELNYTNSEQQRIIFKLGIDNTLIHKLAIYVDDDINDIFNLERIKNLVMNDNTMGADSLEKSLMLTSKSSSELFDKLKSLADTRDEKIRQQQEFDQKQHQELIDSQERMKKAELEFKAEQAELDRVNKLEEARIRAVGYGNSTADEIGNELIQLQQLKLKEADLNRARAQDEFEQKLKTAQFKQQSAQNEKQILSNESIKLMELDLRKKELEEARARTAVMAKKKDSK